MIRRFQDADFFALAELYNRFAPEKYHLDPEIIRLHTVDADPLFDWGASCLCDDAFVSIKKPASRLYKGPDQDTAHLSLIAYSDPRIAIDVMDEVKTLLRNRGYARLAFGTDNRHFFPGCPIDFHNLHDFLTIQGFEEGGLAFDLERNLVDYENPAAPVPGDEYRPVVSTEDIAALEEFFNREFPHRWKYDVFSKLQHELDPSCAFGLFRDGSCEGFALLQREGCVLPIGGAVWRSSLGSKWGSLGPIGVSQRVRGQGSGNALLGHALAHLRDTGTERCIIDWTNLGDFYGMHGFEITRQYRMMSLSLD